MNNFVILIYIIPSPSEENNAALDEYINSKMAKPASPSSHHTSASPKASKHASPDPGRRQDKEQPDSMPKKARKKPSEKNLVTDREKKKQDSCKEPETGKISDSGESLSRTNSKRKKSGREKRRSVSAGINESKILSSDNRDNFESGDDKSSTTLKETEDKEKGPQEEGELPRGRTKAARTPSSRRSMPPMTKKTMPSGIGAIQEEGEANTYDPPKGRSKDTSDAKSLRSTSCSFNIPDKPSMLLFDRSMLTYS